MQFFFSGSQSCGELMAAPGCLSCVTGCISVEAERLILKLSFYTKPPSVSLPLMEEKTLHTGNHEIQHHYQ